MPTEGGIAWDKSNLPLLSKERPWEGLGLTERARKQSPGFICPLPGDEEEENWRWAKQRKWWSREQTPPCASSPKICPQQKSEFSPNEIPWWVACTAERVLGWTGVVVYCFKMFPSPSHPSMQKFLTLQKFQEQNGERGISHLIKRRHWKEILSGIW